MERAKIYAMEAYPLAATHNNALSCKDATEVTEIVRSLLADQGRVVQHARTFAERFNHTGNQALYRFISKIAARHSDELSIPSQTCTRTQPLITNDDSCDHFSPQDSDGTDLKENGISCPNKVCTHFLDLIIALMAAAGNVDAVVGGTSRESKDKRVPVDSLHDEPAKTANSFKEFSLRMWRKGVKSTGLFKDGTTAPVTEIKNETSSKYDTATVCECNKKENNKQKIDLEEKHDSAQDDSKCTEKKSSSFDSPPSLEIATKQGRANQITTDNGTANASQQKRPRRKLPNLIREGLLTEADLADVRPGEAHSTTLVKKLELEKEELKKEASALKSQTEMLIEENRNVKASLEREQTEKENVTQKCKELQVQLDELERSARQHTFMLNSRLERLQHAKLAADQGCLHLSLRQERLAVYEQQATLICQRLTDTVRRELKQRHGLFGVAGINYTNSMTHFTWDDYPADSDGLAMYETHRKLENDVVELIKRYRAVMHLLTGSKDEGEKLRDCYEQESSIYHDLETIEEGQDAMLNYLTEDDEHYQKHGDYKFVIQFEAESSRAVSNHGAPAEDLRRHQRLNTVQRHPGRETTLKLGRKSDKRTRKGTNKHIDHFTCQERVADKLDMEEIKSLKDLPSGSASVASENNQYPRRSNSLHTVDRHHGQRSCSSIVALVRSGQQGEQAQSVRNTAECSACRRNREQSRKLKKSMSTCRSRGRMSNIHYV